MHPKRANDIRGVTWAGGSPFTGYDPGGMRHEVSTQYKIEVESMVFSISKMEVLARYPDAKVSTSYRGEVTLEQSDAGYVVTFTPREKESVGKGFPLRVFPTKSTEKELLDCLAAGVLEFRFEIDSADNKKTVFANVQRKLGGRDLEAPPSAKKGAFTLKRGDMEANLIAEVWPYKSGAKVVVTGTVGLHVTSSAADSRTIDVKQIQDDTKKAIKEIVAG